MSRRLHIVSPLKHGLIRLVATLLGKMIKLMVSLSDRISSLPPIPMSFISKLIIYIFMLMIIMCLNYLCFFT
jgi:hypothetical protein